MAAKSKRAQYTPELWSTIRALFESGEFKSIPDLHEHCTKTLKVCPSLDAIKKRAGSELWNKHDQDEQKTEEKKKNFSEYFSELGMDDKKTAELIVEGMHAGGDIGQKLINAIMNSATGPEIPDDTVIEVVKEYTMSLKERKHYINLFCKLTGAYAPEKLKITSKDGDLQKKQTRFSDLTDDQLKERIAVLKKRNQEV